MALHPTKPILVTASDDKTWKMWHMPEGDLIMCGEGHKVCVFVCVCESICLCGAARVACACLVLTRRLNNASFSCALQGWVAAVDFNLYITLGS